jgi:uncharacterized protein (TIGR02118 family)
MPKVIMLNKRAPGLALGDFHAGLREVAQRAVPPQGCTRYVQSHTLPQGYRKGELLYDALEEAWFDDLEDARAYRHILLLGRPAFSGLVDAHASLPMIVDPHRVKQEPIPAGAVKNIEFVNRRPGMALKPFRDYWKRVHGPLGATIPTILGYEQNHCHDDEYVQGEPRFDGLAITWFESTRHMREGAQTEPYRLTREDEKNFLPDGHLPIIITTEVVDTGSM